MSGVDSLQNNADQQVASLLPGTGNADIGGAMVSVEKADVAFQTHDAGAQQGGECLYQRDVEKMQFPEGR